MRYVHVLPRCVSSPSGVRLPPASESRTDGEFAAQCAVLGLRTVRTVQELTAAYRPLILQWHPDRHHGQSTHAVALERATAINEAYAFLLAALARDRAPAVAPHTAWPHSARPHSAWPHSAWPPSRHGGGDSAPDGFPDASVLEIFVKRSNIISVGYNRATADLFVKYLGHRIYRYRGVPPTVVAALLEAPSASAFVRAHIDRRYESDALKRPTRPPRA
jgi:KTSC domain/DnaJ domain